jgi:hypothetical protein
LEGSLEKIKGLVADMKEGGSADALLEELTSYEKMMIPHLLDEEVECLPLMRAYFTPKDVAPKIQEIIASGPKVSFESSFAILAPARNHPPFCLHRCHDRSRWDPSFWEWVLRNSEKSLWFKRESRALYGIFSSSLG